MKIFPYLCLVLLSLGLLLFRYQKPKKVVAPAPISATTTGIVPVPASVPVPTSHPVTSHLPIIPVPRKVPWPSFPTNSRNNSKKKAAPDSLKIWEMKYDSLRRAFARYVVKHP